MAHGMSQIWLFIFFAKKIINDEEIKVFNHGKMKRDFTYVDDIIKGTISALESDYKYEIFNLGNSKSEELMDVIKIIEHELKIKAKINFEPNQPGDVIETYADISHSINKLNYNPKVNIEAGIPKFIQWFREYHNV